MQLKISNEQLKKRAETAECQCKTAKEDARAAAEKEIEDRKTVLDRRREQLDNERAQFDKDTKDKAEEIATARIKEYEKETEADRTAAKNDREAAAEELKKAREDAAKIREEAAEIRKARQKEWLPYAKKVIYVIGILLVAFSYFAWQGLKLEIADRKSEVKIRTEKEEYTVGILFKEKRMRDKDIFVRYLKDLVNKEYDAEKYKLSNDHLIALSMRWRELTYTPPQPEQPKQKQKAQPKKQPKKQKKKTEKASASEQAAIEQLEQKQEPQEKSEAEEVMDNQDRAWQEALNLRKNGYPREVVNQYLMETYGFTFQNLP